MENLEKKIDELNQEKYYLRDKIAYHLHKMTNHKENYDEYTYKYSIIIDEIDNLRNLKENLLKESNGSI